LRIYIGIDYCLSSLLKTDFIKIHLLKANQQIDIHNP
jgi:hypothetical protein